MSMSVKKWTLASMLGVSLLAVLRILYYDVRSPWEFFLARFSMTSVSDHWVVRRDNNPLRSLPSEDLYRKEFLLPRAVERNVSLVTDIGNGCILYLVYAHGEGEYVVRCASQRVIVVRAGVDGRIDANTLKVLRSDGTTGVWSFENLRRLGSGAVEAR